jgi:hypothetical protein
MKDKPRNNAPHTDEINTLIEALRGPIGADVEIPGTPDIGSDVAARSTRIDQAVTNGLQAAQAAGVPALVGLRLAIQGAVASEIEHAKREILLELHRREEQQYAAASLAAGKEHGEA